MYVIRVNNDTYDNHVLWGPKIWDKNEMQNFLFRTFQINFPLQWANPNEKIIEVNEEISIWPVIFTNDPTRNKRTEFLDGPFYDWGETHAEQYYVVQTLEVDQAKSILRDAVKKARETFIDQGVSYTIGDDDYLLETNVNNFENGIPGNWYLKRITSQELDEDTGTTEYNYQKTWATLTQDQLDDMCSTIKQFRQDQFDLERTETEKIDALTTIEECANHSFTPSSIQYLVERYN